MARDSRERACKLKREQKQAVSDRRSARGQTRRTIPGPVPPAHALPGSRKTVICLLRMEEKRGSTPRVQTRGRRVQMIRAVKELTATSLWQRILMREKMKSLEETIQWMTENLWPSAWSFHLRRRMSGILLLLASLNEVVILLVLLVKS